MVTNTWMQKYVQFLTFFTQDGDLWLVPNQGQRRVKTLQILVEFF